MTSLNILLMLLSQHSRGFVCEYSPCFQIVHVGTCSSLNEAELHVLRGSIGLADSGADTPLTQGQDIPLTGAEEEEEEEAEEDMNDTERREDTEETQLPHFPPRELVKGQNGKGDVNSERQRGQRERKPMAVCE